MLVKMKLPGKMFWVDLEIGRKTGNESNCHQMPYKKMALTISKYQIHL